MRWNGKKGAHEQPSAMVSTSPITASSCSSPGCCGSVAVARSFFDRSLHRHSTARAVLRQKKKGLNERATAAASAPALSSAGMHSPLRAIHSRKNVQRHRSHGILACTYAHSVGSHASVPLRFRSGAAPSASWRVGVRGAYCQHARGTVPQASVFSLYCSVYHYIGCIVGMARRRGKNTSFQTKTGSTTHLNNIEG